jgi:APA family basic amino acid/polyamine antiporter
VGLFRRKDIAELIQGTEGKHALRKSLGAMDLVLLGIGCIIGTGIFVLTGVAAAQYAGPGIMLSFVLSGIACTFAALAYAEMASMIPHAWTAVPADGGMLNVPAILIVTVITFLLTIGTKESATVNKILVFIKLACVAVFLLLATSHVNPMNWQPFLPFGLSGVAAGAAIVFFAYIGFDAVSTAAEECAVYRNVSGSYRRRAIFHAE